MKEPLIADRYRLLDLLGSGGEARVFRAEDTRDGRHVAVRLPIHVEGEPATVPAIDFHVRWVQLLGSGKDLEKGPYQVYELLEGETLHRQVQRGRLADEAWVTFIAQSLESVEALHAAGWVHGDLNAENLFHVAASSSWKLLELPFLRFAAPSDRSAMFGSIHTLAPEQLEGHAADSRSDLYSLGCLYYYAAAGEYPHAGKSRQDIVISLLRFPPTPLREKDSRRPAGAAEWVMQLLQRDPLERYASIKAAREGLQEFRRI